MARGGDKEVPIFPKGISLKVNAVTRLEFELTHYDVVAQHVSHYTTGTPQVVQIKFFFIEVQYCLFNCGFCE